MIQETLESLIIKRILESKDKRITFQEFMDFALYHPSMGYYNRPVQKIGKQGDFYTNSSVNDVFGHVLADQIVEMFGRLDKKPFTLIEYGAGNGMLASHILDRLSLHPHLYSNMTLFMIEKSKYHQELQRHQLAAHRDRIRWVKDLSGVYNETNHHEAVIYSNELLDAFPVHRIRFLDGVYQEQYVIADEINKRLSFDYGPLSSEGLNMFIEQKGIDFQEGQIGEVNLSAVTWITSVAEWLRKGFVLTIDYGYERKELYSSYRSEGTLMCYFKHRNDFCPLENIGEQDMTSHVDFTTVMEQGEEAGLDNIVFVPQKDFLLRSGILHFLSDAYGEDPFTSPKVKRNRAVRQLIEPGGMGDAFSVLIQVKGLEAVSLSSANPSINFPMPQSTNEIFKKQSPPC